MHFHHLLLRAVGVFVVFLSVAVSPGFAQTGAAPLVKKVNFLSEAGTVFKDCRDCPEMVVIPEGKFRMGDLHGVGHGNEQPVHWVEFRNRFAVGKTEITQAQWKYVMGNSPSKATGPNLPVESITWADAQAFVKKLSEKTGARYRLLTESEWEYVARAGTDTKFHCGNGERCLLDVGWSRLNSEMRSHPVGQKKPNAFGLYDIHGNVWEWVQDCYEKSYEHAPLNGDAVTDAKDCKRITRGGSWFNLPRGLRSGHRFHNDPKLQSNNLGLRIARDLD